jgi:predicted enzyme related to lactoylglutathione lyase
MAPTLSNGKICYLEIPATDVARSAAFYEAGFGWELRERGDGATAFDDSVGEVSGTWVTGRPPSTEAGLMVYVVVDSVESTMDAVRANGGEIVQEIGGDPGEITARFTDPGGNLIGLYQEPSSS